MGGVGSTFPRVGYLNAKVSIGKEGEPIVQVQKIDYDEHGNGDTWVVVDVASNLQMEVDTSDGDWVKVVLPVLKSVSNEPPSTLRNSCNLDGSLASGTSAYDTAGENDPLSSTVDSSADPFFASARDTLDVPSQPAENEGVQQSPSRQSARGSVSITSGVIEEEPPNRDEIWQHAEKNRSFKFSCRIKASADTYWDTICTKEYEKHQQAELKIIANTIAIVHNPKQGIVYRHDRVFPSINLPGPLKKLTGGDTSYYEHTWIDLLNKEMIFTTRPAQKALSSRVRVDGLVTVQTDPNDDSYVVQTMRLKPEAKIPFIGKLAENVLSNEMKNGYKIMPDLYSSFLKKISEEESAEEQQKLRPESSEERHIKSRLKQLESIDAGESEVGAGASAPTAVPTQESTPVLSAKPADEKGKGKIPEVAVSFPIADDIHRKHMSLPDDIDPAALPFTTPKKKKSKFTRARRFVFKKAKSAAKAPLKPLKPLKPSHLRLPFHKKNANKGNPSGAALYEAPAAASNIMDTLRTAVTVENNRSRYDSQSLLSTDPGHSVCNPTSSRDSVGLGSGVYDDPFPHTYRMGRAMPRFRIVTVEALPALSSSAP